MNNYRKSEAYRSYQKKYQQDNKDKHSAYVLASYQKNKTVRNLTQAEYGKVYRLTPEGKFASYKGCAKKYKREWKLTLEEFRTLYMGTCFVTPCNDRVTGLDRIDSSKGYVLDNVRPSCERHNQMKNDMTDEQCYQKMK